MSLQMAPEFSTYNLPGEELTDSHEASAQIVQQPDQINTVAELTDTTATEAYLTNDRYRAVNTARDQVLSTTNALPNQTFEHQKTGETLHFAEVTSEYLERFGQNIEALREIVLTGN